MGAVVNQVTLRKGLNAAFVKAFNNGEDPADVMPFIMQTKSTSNKEDYGWLGQSPNLTEWVDQRKLKALNEFEYTIPNRKFEGTLSVDEDSIEDDQLGNVDIRINDLANKARQHPRQLFYEQIIKGDTELAYDGATFFSASHQEGASGVQSNIVSGSGVTLANLKTDLIAANNRLRSFLDDVGQPFNEGEVQWGIVCPVGLEFLFDELNTEVQISSSTNSIKGKIKKITSSVRLSGNDWYLSDLNGVMSPIIQQNRRAPRFVQQKEDSDSGFMSGVHNFGVDYRVGFGFGLWQKMIKINN